MNHSPETGAALIGTSVEGTPSTLDPRIKLRDCLPNLTPRDASFIEAILSSDNNDLLTNVVGLLEDNPEKAKRLTEERMAVQRVDIMELMTHFNTRERRIIAENLVGIQMTDGCTVGCAWCGAEAKRGIDKAFSLKSFMEFMRTYGRSLPGIVSIFDSSDPFDWISEDGKDDYETLARVFFEQTNNSFLSNSTAVPRGSELSIVRFLLFSDRRTRERLKKKKGVDIGFRFSQTKDNRERIDKIMQILRSLGISDEFPGKVLEVVNREPNGKRVKKIGRFVNHPDREEDGEDLLSIMCIEGLYLSPPSTKTTGGGQTIESGGIESISAEAVTLENPAGTRKIRVTPGLMEIPNLLSVEDYTWPLGRKADSFFSMLPKHIYRVYRDGKLAGVKVIESVRRDASSFYIALFNLTTLSKMFLNPEGREYYQENPKRIRYVIKAIREKFVPEFEERRQSCLALLPEESDEQAKRVALSLIGKIDNWLVNIDTHLGINTAEFYSKI